jgi:hypothetical protein
MRSLNATSTTGWSEAKLRKVLQGVSYYNTDMLGFTLFSPTYELSIFCNVKQGLVAWADARKPNTSKPVLVNAETGSGLVICNP